MSDLDLGPTKCNECFGQYVRFEVRFTVRLFVAQCVQGIFRQLTNFHGRVAAHSLPLLAMLGHRWRVGDGDPSLAEAHKVLEPGEQLGMLK